MNTCRELLRRISSQSLSVRMKVFDEAAQHVLEMQVSGADIYLYILRIGLSDRNTYIRTSCIEALAEIRSNRDFGRISKMISDREWVVRATVISGLANMNCEKSFDLICNRLIRDKSPIVRRYAAVAIKDCIDPRAVEILKNQFKRERSPAVRPAISHGLAILGQDKYVSEWIKSIGKATTPQTEYILDLVAEDIGDSRSYVKSNRESLLFQLQSCLEKAQYDSLRERLSNLVSNLN